MEKKNTVTSLIYGSEYTVCGTESSEYISKVCEEVDSKMHAIASAASLNTARAAVLCAINICADKLKLQEQAEQLKKDISTLEANIAEMEKQNRVLLRENNYLKSEYKPAAEKPHTKKKDGKA